jgi:hypothetical protein
MKVDGYLLQLSSEIGLRFPLTTSPFVFQMEVAALLIASTTPLEMCIEVIKRFQASRLSDRPHRVCNTGAVQPPELTYQDEFFRSIDEVACSGVRVCPSSCQQKVHFNGISTASFFPRSGVLNLFMMGITWGSTPPGFSYAVLIASGWTYLI